MTTSKSPLLKYLPPDTVLQVVTDFLDEPALSSLAAVCSHVGPCVSKAWIRLATHRCRSTNAGDGTKVFTTTAVARTFLQARSERIRTEHFCCVNPLCDTGGGGLLRCSKCKVAMYCCRDCQASDWNNHKHICKKLVKNAKEMCRLAVPEGLVFCPWGPYLSDFKPQEPSQDAGVYAEYDPETFAFRGFGSTLNLANTLEEKSLHNNGIFHIVFDLGLFLAYAESSNNNDLLHAYLQFIPLVVQLQRSLLRASTSVPLGAVRALEGLLTKTNVGKPEDNFAVFQEQIGSP